MNRKVLILFGGIISILLISMIISILIKNGDHDNSLVPHYKQAFIKFKGQSDILTNEQNKLMFLFIDEKKYSDFSKDYIKTIKVIDENNNKYLLSDWKIVSDKSTSDYTLKKLDASILLKNPNLTPMNTLEVSFIDGKTKKYSIGKLKLNVMTKRDYLKDIGPGSINTRLIYAVDKKNFVISGLDIIINSFNSKCLIRSINTGVSNIQLNTQDIKVVPYGTKEPFVTNLVNDAREKSEEWVKIFNKAEIANNNSHIKPINISIGNTKELNNYTSLLVPFSLIKTENLSEFILCFEIKVKCSINKEIKYLKSGSTVIYNPLSDNAQFNYYKYLKENGV